MTLNVMTTPLDLAITDLGYTETPPGSNRTKYGERFFPGHPSPWCAEAVSCWTKDAGADGPWSASVGFYRNLASAQGKFRTLDQALHELEVGNDIAVGFEWEHDSWPDHLALLVGLGEGLGTIRTIEGNAPGPPTGYDSVAYHQRSTSLVAFYSVIINPTAVPGAPVPPNQPLPPVQPVHPGKPLLPPWMYLTWKPANKPGFTNHGDKVAVLQRFFEQLGGPWDPGKIDGIIGPRTNDIIGRFQDASHIHKDWIVGQETWRAAFG